MKGTMRTTTHHVSPQLRSLFDVGQPMAIRCFAVLDGLICGQIWTDDLARPTMDADLVANLREEGIAPFIQALGEAFYADAETMHEAIGQHRSFNLIHLDARFKLGVFVARSRDFGRAQLARRQLHLLGEDPDRLLVMQAYYGERRLDHDTPLATTIYQ